MSAKFLGISSFSVSLIAEVVIPTFENGNVLDTDHAKVPGTRVCSGAHLPPGDRNLCSSMYCLCDQINVGNDVLLNPPRGGS